MSEFSFRTGRDAEAGQLVKRFHYSRRVPANVVMVGSLHRDGGLFGGDGEMVAACFFSIPPTRWSEPVIELSRLVRDESVATPLTSLIAQTCREMKRQGHALLVSFADWTQGHHGGIYQASSWNFHGKRDDRQDGLMVNGAFVPGRSANSLWGTRSPEKLRALLPGADIQPHFDNGKYLYWRALSRVGEAMAKQLQLDAKPYPRPDEQRAA